MEQIIMNRSKYSTRLELAKRFSLSDFDRQSQTTITAVANLRIFKFSLPRVLTINASSRDIKIIIATLLPD